MEMSFKKFLEDITKPELAKKSSEFNWRLEMAKKNIDYLTGLWEQWIFAKQDAINAPTKKLHNIAQEKARQLMRIIDLYDSEDKKKAE